MLTVACGRYRLEAILSPRASDDSRLRLRLRLRRAAFRHQLPDLRHGVVAADLGDDLSDLLRGRMRIAGEAVVHSRWRVRILPASTTAAATCGSGQARISRRLPLFRRLTRRIERHGLVRRADVDAGGRL